MTPFPFALHAVGALYSARALVRADLLHHAAATCAPPFDPAAEQYASAFRFGPAMAAHLKANGGSSRGFGGPVWSPVVHFDFDAADDLAAALTAGRQLVVTVLLRYPKVSEDDAGIYYSGGRSVHVELPLPHNPGGRPMFHATARELAARLARLAGADRVPGVTFDAGNYDRVRLWRLVNSRHKSGLHKVRLSYDELMHLSPEGVRKLAGSPRPFDPPTHPVGDIVGELEHDWNQAAAAVGARERDRADRRERAAAGGGPDRLNRRTLDFIGGGADPGDRHRLLYSAARNLAEFDCPPKLAFALLMPAALDTGLAPADAARQVECGLKDGATTTAEGGCPGA